MKRIVFAFAALAAFQAAAITATKEYVDRRDTEIRTNTYTKAETDARIGELAPTGGVSTNDVCNIVTNEVEVGDWQISGGAYIASGLAPDEEEHYNVPATISEISCYTNAADIPRNVSNSIYEITGDLPEYWLPVYSAELSVDSGDIGGTAGEIISSLVVSSGRSEGDFTGNTVSRLFFENDAIDMTITVVRGSRNALGLARLTDIEPTVSNTVTKAYVEDLGIESGISASTATNIAFAVSADATNSLAKSLAPTIAAATNALTRQEAISGFTEWTYNPSAPSGYSYVIKYVYVGNEFMWVVCLHDSSGDETIIYYLADFTGFETRINFDYSSGGELVEVTATRTRLPMASTNYANTAAANAVANADTTYRRTIGITNLNQSVQYVNITDPSPSTLAIIMPTDGVTKDWMVYVVSVTNVTLSLPSATWWMADVAYTNDVPPAKPTAFYFSQISTNIFYLGRQELTEVTP